MNDQRHSVGSHRPSLRPCPEESLGEYLIIDLIHAKTRFQVSGLVFKLSYQHKYKVWIWPGEIQFSSWIWTYALSNQTQKMYHATKCCFLREVFFYEYAFVLIKRRTGFLTTFKRDCPINFFLQRHRIEFMRKPIKSVKLLTDHKQNCNCDMSVEMNVIHFFSNHRTLHSSIYENICSYYYG